MTKIKLKGRHSKVFVRGKKLVKKFDKKLSYNFWKEAFFLTILQPYKFVPKLYSVKPELLEIEMEFLNGVYLQKWIDLHGNKVVKACLKVCHTLDRLGIRKEEMTHPDRHIIVVNSKPYFIDFERSHFVALRKNPGNVTQFVTYLTRIGLFKLDKELVELLKNYKQNIENFNKLESKIVKLLSK